MSFPLFTSIPPGSNFSPLVGNWESSGFKVTSINCREEANILRAAGLDVIEVESAQKRLKISEIMYAIANTGLPFAGFINADCRFIESIDSERLSTLARNSLILAERIDVDEAGALTNVLCCGFDAFFFDTAALQSLTDAGYRIGTPWWDYWFPLVMQRSGLELKRFSCPILLHTTHDLNWDDDSYLDGGRTLQAEFPNLRIIKNGRPDAIPPFTHLWNSPTVLPPNINIATAELLSTIPALVKARQEAASLEREVEALRNSKLLSSIPAMVKDIQSENTETETLRQKNARLEREVEALRNSNSYRITYPLRLAATLARDVYAKVFAGKCSAHEVSIDRVILRAAKAGPDEGPDHLVGKFDHLVHSLRISGRLARLSREQIVTILHELRLGGHDEVPPPLANVTYNQDGLISIYNADFLRDARFVDAYRRGTIAAGADYSFHWRVHVGLWAADHAVRLPGDFVECGVNRGFMSSAVMRHLDWNSLGKRFILMDTFQRLDEALISEEGRALATSSAYNAYTEYYEQAVANFAEFRNVEIIRGSIPLTLSRADTHAVCFLHLDMNCVIPEVAAIEYFWDRLVPGAVVLLNDYGARNYEPQKRGVDEFATKRGVSVLSLPTGQGLILKSR